VEADELLMNYSEKGRKFKTKKNIKKLKRRNISR